MRPSNKSRSRNKSGGNGSRRNIGNIINRVFESAGPDGKVRGTPQQIIEKYNALARDAQLSGDRVAAESFLQHAEHYSRMLSEAQRQLMEQRPENVRADRDDSAARDDQPDATRASHQGDPTQFREPTGLTTIEHADAQDPRGPVDTPEDEPTLAALGESNHEPEVPSAVPNGKAEAAMERADGSAEQTKRPRPRRRPRTTAPAVGAQAE